MDPNENAPAPDAEDPIAAALNSMDDQPATDTNLDPNADLSLDFAKEMMEDEPAKPEAEKPPEEKPEPEKPTTDEDEVPEKATKKADWDKLRASRDKHKTAAEEREKALTEREARIKAIESELTETKAKTARLAELEARAKEADEYEKELAVTRVEATKEYKETIAKPLQVIGEQAEILATSNEADVEAIYRMLNEPDPAKQRTQLKEITAGWDEIDRGDLRTMAADARAVLAKQVQIRENAFAAQKETEKLSAERAEQQKTAARKEFSAAADSAVASLREKVPFVPLADGETEDDRYNGLKEKLAKVDFDAQTPRGKAFAAATALLYPSIVKTLAKKDAEITELKAALAKKGGGKPSIGPATETAPEKDKDFFEEFGIRDAASLLGSHSIDVQG